MHRSIDMKSVLIGGLLVALALCIAGAVPFVGQEMHGRFQIVTDDPRAFILDSATGQAWGLYGLLSHYDPKFFAVKVPQTDVDLEY